MKISTLYRWFRRNQLSGTNILIVLSIFVGLATSLGAIGFVYLIEYFNEIFFGLTDQALTEAMGDRGFKFWLPLIPLLGGLLVHPLYFYQE